MNQYKFLIASIIIVVLDSIYLNVIKGFFNKQIKTIQGSDLKINMTATVLCYIFIVSGFNYFVIDKKLSHYDAGLLGIMIYGIYELTNMALFKNWKWSTVIIDTLWGGVLFFLTSFIVNLFFKK